MFSRHRIFSDILLRPTDSRFIKMKFRCQSRGRGLVTSGGGGNADSCWQRGKRSKKEKKILLV